jgi:hypothetical protein
MVFLQLVFVALRLLVCFSLFVYAVTGKQGNVYDIVAKGQGKPLKPFYRVLSLLLALTMLAGAFIYVATK